MRKSTLLFFLLSVLTHVLVFTAVGIGRSTKPQSAERIEITIARQIGGLKKEDRKGSSQKGQNSLSTPVLGSDFGIQVRYPRLSRILNEKGEVAIKIKKNRDSSILIEILESSGFSRLDQSALEATEEGLKTGKFSDLLKTQSEMQIRFIFKLTAE